MRVLLVAGVLAAAATAADAGCGQKQSGILTLTDWSATMKKDSLLGDYPSIKVAYRNDNAKEIRMIKATVQFDDALGDHIGSFLLDKDIRIKPSQTKKGDFAFSGYTPFERLPKLEKRDATAYICVESVVYEDGTKEEFK
jgi:hypothetical protein